MASSEIEYSAERFFVEIPASERSKISTERGSKVSWMAAIARRR